MLKELIMFPRKYLALKVKSLKDGEFGYIDPAYVYTDAERNVVVWSDTLVYYDQTDEHILYIERTETCIRVYWEDLTEHKIVFREIIINTDNSLPVELEGWKG